MLQSRAFRLAAVLLLVATGACDDGPRAATPYTPVTPIQRDAGLSDEGWGDVTTTRRDGVLRLGQLNVRRYFDSTCDSNQCGSGGFEDVATPTAFEDRTTQLAEGLARFDADVITLAEVEDQVCIDALQAKLKANGYEYPIAYIGETGLPGSVDVAVLSRGKLDSVKTYKKDTPLTRPDGTKTSFTRELPELHLKIGSNSVIVYAAHFRSKAEDDPGRRVAEAKATHDIMVATDTANPGAIILLGGDLNDVPGSDTINAMEAGGALVRVAKDIPADQQGTYLFQGQDQAIDHIFTTSSRATAYVPKSATVVRDPGKGLAGSDHAGIYADFNLP